jgi:predicted transglutaminase-like cysteine proteinase
MPVTIKRRVALSALWLSALIASQAHAQFMGAPPVNRWIENPGMLDWQSCKRHPGMPWCTKTQNYPTVAVTEALVHQIDANVRKGYNYISDQQQYGVVDRWDSHIEAVEQGQAWGDDCDGLTETVLDYASHRGVPKDHMWRLSVSTVYSNDDDEFNHMVGMIKTDDGRLFIVGDAMFSGPYEVPKLRWNVRYVSSAAEVRKWRRPDATFRTLIASQFTRPALDAAADAPPIAGYGLP